MFRHTRAWLTVTVIALLGVAAASGQTHPNLRTGLSPEAVYETAGLQAVDVFNGRLRLAIPIGIEYPVSETLSYRLSLVYNSRVWDFSEAEDGGSFYVRSDPSRWSNAGLGWRLSLGELEERPDLLSPQTWQYVDRDGAVHVFYDDLLFKEPPGSPDVLYTRDLSYLRLSLDATGDRLVEFPNGTVHRFEPHADGWRLAEMRDLFTGSVQVTYPSPTLQVLTDSHGRTHEIERDANGQVVSVRLAAFGGTTATYTFSYAETSIDYSCKDTYPSHAGAQVVVPLLTEVSLPDGSTYSMTGGLDPYYFTASECGVADRSGLIERLILPTRGQTEWEWSDYPLPGTELGAEDWHAAPPGVTARIHRDEEGVEVGRWTHTPEALPDPEEMRVSVAHPTGHCTAHYFSTDPELDPVARSGWSYGLPFSPLRSLDTGFDGVMYLSREEFETADCSSEPLRSTYVKFSHDWLPDLPGPGEEEDPNLWYDTNRRPSGVRTVFHDDGDRYREVVERVYDGLGHYRQRIERGNFVDESVGKASDSRESWFFFNEELGCTEPQPGQSCDFEMFPEEDPWALETLPEVQSGDNFPSAEGANYGSSLCFDELGTLTRLRRRVQGISDDALDILEVYERDAQGQVVRQTLYGGASHDLPVGVELCSLDVPALGPPAYERIFEYQHGVMSRATFVDESGAELPFDTLDADVDLSTGLVAAARDPSGPETTFEYDALGRMTLAAPAAGHDAHTAVEYAVATVDAPATVRTTRVENGGGATLAETTAELDAFGRLAYRSTLQPGFARQRLLRYNARGWLIFESTAKGNETQGTEYLDHDPFGRPRLVRPPDGSEHDVVFAYLGDREVERTAMVGTGPDGAESPATRLTRFDALGRLHQLAEAVGTGEDVFTTYEHNALDQIVEIRQWDAVTGRTQTRTFGYDGRGLLKWNYLPETADYRYWDSYDPLGNPAHARGRVADFNPLTWRTGVRLEYDRAGRPVEIWELEDLDGHQPRLLQTMEYGTANDGTDLRLGKLVAATRYNLDGGPAITQRYEYRGRGGRPSRRRTEVDGAERFRQAFTWTELGRIEGLGYPLCIGCGGTGPTRTVEHRYQHGLLTEVVGYADGIQYKPGGGPYLVPHTNGIDDQHFDDPMQFQLQRIRVVRSGTTIFDTGTYEYDGDGHVTSIGFDEFTYDVRGRLVGAEVAGVAESYVYDGFGNLEPADSRLAIDLGNNRLKGVWPNDVDFDDDANLCSIVFDDGSLDRSFEFDAMNRLTSVSDDGFQESYWYAPTGERIAIAVVGGLTTWRVRDLSGNVLRELHEDPVAGTWSWQKDYVYRDGRLLAAERAADGVRHFHLDHLGTPRLVTRGDGTVESRHDYLPSGVEITAPTTEVMKFTGHERDFGLFGELGNLDHMHARQYSPGLGRFLSVDPVGAATTSPRGLNRYGYVMGDPMRFRDPNGLEPEATFGGEIDVVGDPFEFALLPVGFVDFVGAGIFFRNMSLVLRDPGIRRTWDPITDQRIAGLHPCARGPARALINLADEEGELTLRVADGFRSLEEQRRMFARGRMVTNARPGQSYHNYGLAIDVAPIAGGQVVWDIDWAFVGRIGESLGFEWGGRWQHPDRPHFQLTLGRNISELQEMTAAELAALECP